MVLSRLLVVCIVFLSVPAHAGTDGLSSDLRRADARLSKAVSLSSPRMTLADIVANLSRQSHVGLTVDDSDSATTEHLTAYLHDVTLADAMDSLWSLLSYKGGAWEWRREGDTGRYRYRLTRPLMAKKFAEGLVDWMQTTFESQAELLGRAALMPPEERATFIRTHAPELNWNDASAVEKQLQSEWSWEGLVAFQQCLPLSARTTVLRGGQTPRIAVSSLSDRGQAFVRTVWSSMRMTVSKRGGPAEPVPMPSWIQFGTTYGGGTAAPVLTIDMEGIGGYGYVGGWPLEQAFWARLENLWLNSGDTRDNSLESRTVPSPTTVPPDPDLRLTSPAEKRCQELSERVPVSLFARLPAKKQTDPGPPDGKTLKEYLETLNERSWLMHKWRGDILLLSSRTWYREQAARVPNEVIQRLRDGQKREAGLLPIKDIAWVMGHLTPAQVTGLVRDFPVLAPAMQFREVFAIMDSSALNGRGMLSERGLPLTPSIRSMLKSNLILGGKVDEVDSRAIKLSTKDTVTDDTRLRSVTIEILNQQGEWKRIGGFLVRARLAVQH